MRVRGQSGCTECTAGERGNGAFHWGVGGGSSCPLSLKAVGNLGRGGTVDDSSDYFGKCPVLLRKEWVEANLACERKKKRSPHSRSGFPGTHSSGQPGTPTPKRNFGILNCRSITYSFRDQPLPPGMEKKGHTHPHMVIKSQVCHYKAEGKTGEYCTVNCRGPHPHPMFNGGQAQPGKVGRLMAGIA